jgi:ferredoxin
MKKLLIFAPLFLLVSCIDPVGTLQVNENLTLVHTTMFGNHKNIKVPVGNYKMQLIVKANDRFKLVIDGIDKAIKIKTKKGIDLPANGTAFFPAADLGQKYDMQIQMNTKQTRSDLRRRWESCTYTVPRTVCDSHGNCHTEYYSVFGHKDIEYYVVTTLRRTKMKMLLTNSNVEAALFSGKDRDAHEVTTWETSCR